jgi:hypothetical protein
MLPATVSDPLSRRDLLRAAAGGLGAWLIPSAWSTRSSSTRPSGDPDRQRLARWTAVLRHEGLERPDGALGPAAVRTGELARGTVYQPGTLDAYLASGRRPRREPLTLSLTRFDCVTLVESCLGVARAAAADGSWSGFGREIERMRYRDGRRDGYSSRLHYFSEWIEDGARRGLVRDLGAELGGAADPRPLRFMTTHRASYPALRDDRVFQQIAEVERRRDGAPRLVVPTKRLPLVVDRIESGDVLAFATEIPGLDVTHAAFAYRSPDGVLRVLHAPLSGGVVEITRTTLPEYVAAIRHATGVLVARPLRA